jgi:hypothetical protein
VACALASLGGGCQGYSTDLSAPVAIEIVTTRLPPFRVEEADTFRVRVVVLDRGGDSIVGRPVRLLSLNPDTLAIDSADFGLVGVRPGSGRVVAISGNLQSAPLVVSVVRAPDSLVASDSTVQTVAAGDTASQRLTAQLLDLRTDTTQTLGLAWSDTIHFAIVSPVFASLAAATAILGNDSLTAAVVTSTLAPLGTASVIVRRKGAPQPDSVVVQASAKRANGTAVRGSPIRFIVHFQ